MIQGFFNEMLADLPTELAELVEARRHVECSRAVNVVAP